MQIQSLKSVKHQCARGEKSCCQGWFLMVSFILHDNIGTTRGWARGGEGMEWKGWKEWWGGEGMARQVSKSGWDWKERRGMGREWRGERAVLSQWFLHLLISKGYRTWNKEEMLAMTSVCHVFCRPIAWVLPVIFLLRLLVEVTKLFELTNIYIVQSNFPRSSSNLLQSLMSAFSWPNVISMVSAMLTYAVSAVL